MEGNRERFGSPRRANTYTTALSSPYSLPSSLAANVKFRILCLWSQVGAVIGVRGGTIQHIRECTKSKIRVEDAPSYSIERVISILAEVGSTSSRVRLGEEDEVEISNAQDALIRVFEILKDAIKTDIVSCRLLIEANHVGSVNGEDGESVESIRKQTGCCMIEIQKDDLPVCADPDDDAMVKIEGNVLAVKKALISISSRLQDRQIYKTRKNNSVDRAFQASLHSPDSVGIHPPSSHPHTTSSSLHRSSEDSFQRGSTVGVAATLRRRARAHEALSQLQSSGQRGQNSTMVTNINDLPENVVNYLCREEDGRNRLQEMRQISGAEVKLLETLNDPLVITARRGERIIKISGTYDQIETAEQLLEAYVYICESLAFIERLKLKGSQR